MNKLLLIWMAALIIASCSTKQSNNSDNELSLIDLTNITDFEDFKLSDFGKSVEYIPLETNDTCLIANNPQIQLLEDKIVVSTEKQCFLFDKRTGKFLCSVGHIGEDPKGYSSTDCWTDDAGILYFFRAPDKLLKYNQEGEMVGTIQLPDTPTVPDYFTFSDSTIIGHYANYIKIQANSLVFFDSSGNKKDSIPSLLGPASSLSTEDITSISVIKRAGYFGNIARKGAMIIQHKDQTKTLHALHDPVLWSSEGEVHFRESFMDTIYTVRDNKLHPYMVLHTGTSHLPTDKWYTVPESITVSYVLENAHSVFFQVMQKNLVYSGIYNKTTHKTKYTKSQKTIVDDFNQVLIADMFTLCSHKGQYGFIVQAGTILDSLEEHPIDKDKSQSTLSWLKQISDDSNPVVVIVSGE